MLAHLRRLAAPVVVLGLALVVSIPAAHATFPGANGKIAFHSDRDGNYEIYTMDPGGGSQTNISNNPATDLTPAWSADGTKIAFVSNRHSNYEIYTMNADGTGQNRITTNSAADVQPAWSADGTKIAFVSDRDGNYEIYTMNTNGTGVVRITNNPANDGQPSWSPDGTKIAFQSNRTANFDIYTMNPDGTGQTNLTDNVAYDELPNWSPDGSYIWFDSDRSGAFCSGTVRSPCFWVWAMKSDGTDVQKGVPNFGFDQFAPAESPNGQVVAFTTKANSPDNAIWLGGPNPTQLTDHSADDAYPDWQPLVNSYARPVGASPLRVPLVPAYKQCTTAANSKHKGALGTPSCVPPTPSSNYLTLGSPDFNGAPAKATGFVRMAVFCNGGAAGQQPPCLTSAGDQLDGSITVSQTDVRCQGTTGNCPNGPLSDYVGNLRFELSARITDRNNGGSPGAGTLQDVPLAFNVSCTATGDATVGSTCSSTTSVDAVLGGASGITEQKRAIWEDLGDVSLYDGGADGDASTLNTNTLFVVDGLFFP